MIVPIRDVNDLCTADADFLESPAREYLRKMGVAVLDDVSLMHRLRS